VNRFEGRVLARKMDQLENIIAKWLGLNARAFAAQSARSFWNTSIFRRCQRRNSSKEQKGVQEILCRRPRDLEHEFGKTMRYKSIRDLAAGDTGQVIQDLKPTLAHEPAQRFRHTATGSGLFDVVIFDEQANSDRGSHPGDFRSHQVIIVATRCNCRLRPSSRQS